MSLAEALEAAAGAIDAHADEIRDANGDPQRLLDTLDTATGTTLLAWLLEHRAADGEELASEWSESDEGAARVLALRDDALPKPARKALRRLHHRLRSRGVEVAIKEKGPVVAALPSVRDEFAAAYLSAVDPAGSRVVYLAEPNPSGGVRIFELIVDDASGILGIEVYTAPRKKARAFLASLGERDRFPMIEVAPPLARAVVAHAEAHQASDRAAPRTFSQWRSHVADGDASPLPGRLVRDALGDPDADAVAVRTAEAAQLVRTGRAGPWPPDVARLEALFERIKDALEGPLIVSGAARQERIDGIIGEEIESLFDEAGSALAAHRFREHAFVLWKLADDEAAHACLAAAVAFEAGSPADNPAARALIEVPLGPALRSLEAAPESGDEPTTDEPRLVTPAGG